MLGRSSRTVLFSDPSGSKSVVSCTNFETPCRPIIIALKLYAMTRYRVHRRSVLSRVSGSKSRQMCVVVRQMFCAQRVLSGIRAFRKGNMHERGITVAYAAYNRTKTRFTYTVFDQENIAALFSPPLPPANPWFRSTGLLVIAKVEGTNDTTLPREFERHPRYWRTHARSTKMSEESHRVNCDR